MGKIPKILEIYFETTQKVLILRCFYFVLIFAYIALNVLDTYHSMTFLVECKIGIERKLPFFGNFLINKFLE